MTDVRKKWGDESALRRGLRIGHAAAKVGFDWRDASGPRRKVAEELNELDEARSSGSLEAVEHELGDVLLAVVNLGRHLGVDPEVALARSLDRFESRFAAVERRLAYEGRRPSECTIDELEAVWQAVKRDKEQEKP